MPSFLRVSAALPARLALAALLLSLLARPSLGCRLGAWGPSAGMESGYCDDPEQFVEELSFCGEYVTYRACLPAPQANWPSHNTNEKDKWVEKQYMDIVGERKRHEMNETLRDNGVNELGESGEIDVRFWNWDTDDPWGEKDKDPDQVGVVGIWRVVVVARGAREPRARAIQDFATTAVGQA